MSHLDTEVEITDEEDLREAVKECRKLDDELEQRRLEVQEEIRRIKQENEGYQERRVDAFNSRVAAITDYVQEHRDEILEREGKTFDLPHGDLLLRSKKASVDFNDSRASVADELEALGREDLVTIKRTVYVSSLDDKPDVCADLDGAAHQPKKSIVRVSVPTGNYTVEDRR